MTLRLLKGESNRALFVAAFNQQFLAMGGVMSKDQEHDLMRMMEDVKVTNPKGGMSGPHPWRTPSIWHQI